MSSLEQFLEAVRSSCVVHAERKGYLEQEGFNPLIEIERILGITQHHALGEILAKMLEFKRSPKRVLAEKIAGWAWRLWESVPEEVTYASVLAVKGAESDVQINFDSGDFADRTVPVGCVRPREYLSSLEPGRRY